MRLWLKGAWAATVVLLGSLPSAAASAPDTTVRIGALTGQSGDEMTARLELLGIPDPGLGAFTIDVAYDASVVSPVSCQGDPSNVLDNAVCNVAFKPGIVRVGGYKITEGLTGDAALADIVFRLSGHDGACTPLSLSVAELTDPNAAPLSSREEEGSICIGSGVMVTSPTPAAESNTTPAATAKPGGPTESAPPNGAQTLATTAPGQTQGAGEPRRTAVSPSSSATVPSGTQGSATGTQSTPSVVVNNGNAGKPQASQGGSQGRPGWLIPTGLVVAAGLAVGALGALLVRRRARP